MLYTPLQIGLPLAKNTKNCCHHMGSFKLRMHQTRFRPGLRPGPRRGSLRRSPRPPGRLGRGTPLSIPLPRHLRRLDLAAIPLLLKDIYANGSNSRGKVTFQRRRGGGRPTAPPLDTMWLQEATV